MNIEYKSSRVRKLCTKEKKGRKKLGASIARSLIKRLYQLQAFENLQDVPTTLPFRRHKLSGEYKNCFAVNIKGPYRLIFKPIVYSGRPIEEISLSEINTIEIWEVTDYHD